jgi:hypothetical protein|tara:strand:- start:373 stop:696 length:324 start_codon:yes stop_codon:yes gene_type:complete
MKHLRNYDSINESSKEIKKSEIDALAKEVNKAVKLIHEAKGILESAAYAIKKLENKDSSDFKDPKSISRSLYNLRSSIKDSMAYSLKDPIKYSGDILTRIIDIGRKV